MLKANPARYSYRHLRRGHGAPPGLRDAQAPHRDLRRPHPLSRRRPDRAGRDRRRGADRRGQRQRRHRPGQGRQAAGPGAHEPGEDRRAPKTYPRWPTCFPDSAPSRACSWWFPPAHRRPSWRSSVTRSRTVMAAPDIAQAAAQQGAVPAYLPAAALAADLAGGIGGLGPGDPGAKDQQSVKRRQALRARRFPSLSAWDSARPLDGRGRGRIVPGWALRARASLRGGKRPHDWGACVPRHSHWRCSAGVAAGAAPVERAQAAGRHRPGQCRLPGARHPQGRRGRRAAGGDRTRHARRPRHLDAPGHPGHPGLAGPGGRVRQPARRSRRQRRHLHPLCGAHRRDGAGHDPGRGDAGGHRLARQRTQARRPRTTATAKGAGKPGAPPARRPPKPLAMP